MLRKSFAKSNVFKSQAFVLIIIYAIMVLFFSLTTENYFSAKNFQGILSSLAVEGFVITGVIFVLLGGNFDMSVGSNIGLTSTLIVYLFKINCPIYLVIIIALLVGIFIGFLNGFITKIIGINSIITTLGVSAILLGVAYLINVFIGKEIITNDKFNHITRVYYGGVFPAIFLYMIIVFIIAGLILKYTKFGRNLYCVGGNPEIARISGINFRRTQILTFMISGFMSSMGAIFLASKLGAGRPDFGENVTLDAITVCVLGGILLSGGKGELVGVFIALILLRSITSGLVMLNIPIYIRYVVSGLILIIAIVINEIRYNRKVFNR